MDFNEFKKLLEDDVGKIISEAYPGATAIPKEIDKLQGQSYSALSISAEGSRLGMNLNMDSLYAQLQGGMSYEDILQQAGKQSLAFLADAPDFDIPDISDYEAIKQKLYVEVVGTKRNEQMLADVPHTEMEDISMICRVQLKGRDGEDACALVTNSLMESLGVEKDRLFADALENSQQIRPAMIRGMGSMLGMLGESSEATDGQLIIVTTQDMVKGASAIFYPDMMQKCREMLDQDFFILPSSVHEVLLLPDDGAVTARELQSMVAEINAMVVDPVDQLTDNVYHYDAEERIFETGLGFEERRAAREAAQEKSGSVLDELRSRQKENEMKPRAPHKAAAKEASL